ncbi:hypothetical protein, partial [Thiolapillus sp.]|uniref:hypothetical protein n=1 Tax=Thiolapillus sp. TaxID=2017437 RepID=UPI003AF9BC70
RTAEILKQDQLLTLFVSRKGGNPLDGFHHLFVLTNILQVSSTLSYSKLHKWQGEDIMQHIVLKG